MRKITLMLSAVMAIGMSAQTVYFDFGGSGNRGTLTTNPDANGHYWNNICPAEEGATTIAAKTEFGSLVDSEGNPMEGLSLFLNNQWGVNGAGGLTHPSADLLGDLAVSTATTDYMFNTNNGDGGRAFVIRGLDRNKGYRFTIFGSRSANDLREGLYTISGTTTWARRMAAAGSGIGANGENYNNSNAPTSDVIFPDAYGKVLIYIVNDATTYIPISLMKMEVVADAVMPTQEGTVTSTYMFDFGSNVSSRGALTEGNWNNICNNDGNYIKADSEFANLVDTEGNSSTMKLTLLDRMTTNGNSGGGGLLSPDATLLGDMAVSTATMDYAFTETGETNRRLVFSGLDPQKSYRFHIFGTRSNAECRSGLYHIEGLTDWYGAQQVAGNAYAASASQNDRDIRVSPAIYPTNSGEITVTIINNAKTYVALSVMKIEEITGSTRPDIVSWTSATLSGGAEGNAELVSTSRNEWYVYTRLTADTPLTVAATDDDSVNDTFTLSNVPNHDGIYRVTVNLDEQTVSYHEVTYFCVEGSAVGAWNTTGEEMTYIGNGKWNFKGELKGYDKTSDNGRVNFVMNKSWGETFKRLAGSPDKLGNPGAEDIPLNPGFYDITVDLNAMTYKVENGLDELDNHRITVMGSSVSNGQGATNNEGYAYMFNEHLGERSSAGLSEHEFFISNIAVNGNSSVNLLNRIDDLEREFGKYVIFAISLGNEGIHGASDQTAIYNQFKTNMAELISRARAQGKTPVVMNNYTRADFVDSDYQHVINMNREIAYWDVPSVNMLGAIDDGAGHWASGYDISTDIYHPNTDGHREFFYAMVPSMFDALESGKSLTMNRTTNVTGEYGSKDRIEYTADGTVHSFTFATTLSGCGTESVVIPLSSGSVKLSLTGGNYVLTLPDGATLSCPATVSRAGTMDEVVISHNYASKTVALNVNGTEQRTTGYELAPTGFTVNGNDGGLNVGEMMFYRSSMLTNNPFRDNQLDKSSLEYYSTGDRAMNNLAMSTTKATLKDMSTELTTISAEDATTRVYYNLQGMRLANPTEGVFVIESNGSENRVVLYR